MEESKDDQVEERTSALSPPPAMGSMQIAGSNGFAHSIEFMSQTYLRNRYSEIDIEDNTTLNLSKDQPLPIFLKFEDVEYKVRNNGQAGGSSMNPVKAVVSKVASQLSLEQDNYKQILKGITGSIGPGEILALMGPSGSGKTTLLNIIGGRLKDNVKGKITVGFVTQDDVLLPQLTVEETLVFAAFLRLPGNMSRQQKYARVETIIKDLGLERCRHTRIGGGFIKGISGGERKRTSIGHEILVDPSLLLLDEPTSGLDSTSANRLLHILQGIAKPSSRIFHTFDKILLISDGYPVYYGKARDSMDYFASLRFMPEIAMNPAEFMLDLATGQVNDISIPQDISTAAAPPGAQNSEKEVVKVRRVIRTLPDYLFPIYLPYPLVSIYMIYCTVPARDVQDSTRAKREGRQPSKQEGSRAFASGYPSEEGVDIKLAGTVQDNIQENIQGKV
ncbi:unnamed protein product [Linum tenue]|uniref:ABC transporter domain-containing protein n=1 Tax=Linum tenue TaxID=586396 RepID=A0AAV0H209_9ROSI|nr:unnamed protein product [Linum tenue]CAI0378564.1 unnamed protein product [Linum tenue]